MGFPGGSAGKESAFNVGDLGLIPGLRIFPGGEHGNPFHYSCLENPRGQRSLLGSSPQSHKESDMIEQLSTAQEIRINNREKTVSSISGAGKTAQLRVKE